MRAAARATGDLLREVGLVPFAMTSGSRGLHVIAPLRRDAGWDEARAFADAVGERLAEDDPEHLTTAFRIAKRGGRIYVDTTRNAYAQHARRALRGAGQAGRAGGDAAALGGARRPGAVVAARGTSARSATGWSRTAIPGRGSAASARSVAKAAERFAKL